MNKVKTSLKNAQAALDISRKNYETKFQQLSQLEQQAQVAYDSGDEATARQLISQAAELESQLSQLDAEIKDLEKFIEDKPKKNNLSPLLLLIPIVLIAGIGYWLWAQSSQQPSQIACFPSGTKLRINGSASMVKINEVIKQYIQKKCSGTSIETDGKGSEFGIQEIINGKIDIAAVSRPLNSQEQAKQLIATYVKRDDIALIISKQDNPYQQGLTSSQVTDIFKGNITNWSALGAKSATIRVINRPAAFSGTQKAFRELVLNNAEFGTTPNIITHPTDVTTEIIRMLKADGISYASYGLVKNQGTVRVVDIDGFTPNSSNYPFKRQLSYIYKEPLTPTAKIFLEHLNSSELKQAIEKIDSE